MYSHDCYFVYHERNPENIRFVGRNDDVDMVVQELLDENGGLSTADEICVYKGREASVNIEIKVTIN